MAKKNDAQVIDPADQTQTGTQAGTSTEAHPIPEPQPDGTTQAGSDVEAKPAKKAEKGAATVQESAAKRVAKEVFKNYPDKKTVFVTSDGLAFFHRCDADNHARELSNKTVTPVSR